MSDNLINIPGRLHSVSTEGIVTGANEVYDDTKHKSQSEINADVDNTLEDAVFFGETVGTDTIS